MGRRAVVGRFNLFEPLFRNHMRQLSGTGKSDQFKILHEYLQRLLSNPARGPAFLIT